MLTPQWLQTALNNAALTSFTLFDVLRDIRSPTDVRRQFMARLSSKGIIPIYSAQSSTFDEWVREHIEMHYIEVRKGDWYLTELGWQRWNLELHEVGGNVNVPC